MFLTDMAEERNDRIAIDDFDSNVIEQLVRYIQTSTIDESLEASDCDLLLIADKYDVCGLKILAQSRLTSAINIETVCAALNAATLVADTHELLAACYRFICTNQTAVKTHESWQTLSESSKAFLFTIIF